MREPKDSGHSIQPQTDALSPFFSTDNKSTSSSRASRKWPSRPASAPQTPQPRPCRTTETSVQVSDRTGFFFANQHQPSYHPDRESYQDAPLLPHYTDSKLRDAGSAGHIKPCELRELAAGQARESVHEVEGVAGRSACHSSVSVPPQVKRQSAKGAIKQSCVYTRSTLQGRRAPSRQGLGMGGMEKKMPV
ncbi:hypothetical protein MTO96_020377 [Rhipicephalus appendiculatus]